MATPFQDLQREARNRGINPIPYQAFAQQFGEAQAAAALSVAIKEQEPIDHQQAFRNDHGDAIGRYRRALQDLQAARQHVAAMKEFLQTPLDEYMSEPMRGLN